MPRTSVAPPSSAAATENSVARRFAIALSFPGEHRDFVEQVATRLGKRLTKKRVFFDDWYEKELVGKNGDLKLRDYYRDNSDIVVPFFSKHYEKQWCKIEWSATRAMLLDRSDAVIPVELDGTKVDGWESVDFAIRLKGRSAEEIADLIYDVYCERFPERAARGKRKYSSLPANLKAGGAEVASNKRSTSTSLVFICHHHSNVDFAREIRARIESLEDGSGESLCRGWIASDELRASKPWAAGIYDALQKARALIIIVTPAANRSRFVTYEWSFAIGRGIPVIPVIYQKAKVHPAIEDIHYRDLTVQDSQAWQQLTEDVQEIFMLKELTPNSTVVAGIHEEVESLRIDSLDQSGRVNAGQNGKTREMKTTDVLLVLDVQQDFFTDGAWPVVNAESLIEPLNKAIDMAVDRGMTVIYARDWHPTNHRSFRNESSDGKWPRHCVQNTLGAQFHPFMRRPENARVVNIGADNTRQGYSAFDDESFVALVNAPEMGKLYIAGIALEYCVRATALEAAKYGKNVVLIESLIRPATQDSVALGEAWDTLDKNERITRYKDESGFFE